MSKRRTLMEMVGLSEASDKDIAREATALAKRYVKSWQQGKGRKDPAVAGIVKDLAALLKKAMPNIKKADKDQEPGGQSLVNPAKTRLATFSKLKPEKITDSQFKEIGATLDDLRMFFG
jgi:hypothetical protein